MKINNNQGINIPVNSNFKTNDTIKKAESEAKQIDTSSLDALSSMGKAQINLAFKGQISSQRTYSFEMSDEEFEAYEKEIKAKFADLPENVQNDSYEVFFALTKANILLLDKILSDERLYKNENIMCHAESIIVLTHTVDEAKSKSTILDKLLSDERLYDNENLMKNAYLIIEDSTKTEEEAEAKSTIIDKLLSDERLYGNEDLMRYADLIIEGTKTAEETEAKSAIINKLLSDERLYGNEDLMQDAGSIIVDTKTLESAEAKSTIIDKLFSDERIYGNEDAMQYVGSIIKNTNTAEESESKSAIIDKLLSDERLYNYDHFMPVLWHIIQNTGTKEELETKSIIIDKLLSDERLYNNESIMKNAGNIIANTNTTESSEAKSAFMDKILSDERLQDNKDFMHYVGYIIDDTKTLESAEAKSVIIDKLYSDERIYNNKEIMNKASSIIWGTNTTEDAERESAIIDKLLSDERLYGNEDLMQDAGSIIVDTKTLESAEAKLAIIDKLLSDERIYTNENVMKNSGSIIDATGTEIQLQLANKLLSDERLYGNEDVMQNAGSIISVIKREIQLQLAGKLLSDERLYGNEDVIQNADSIIKYIRNSESAEAKSAIIDKLLSDERLYNNENVMNNASNIIANTNTLESAESKSAIIDKLLSDERLYANEDIMRKAGSIINATHKEIQLQLAEKLLSDKRLCSNANVIQNADSIISATKIEIQLQLADKLLSDERLYGNENVMNNAGDIIGNTDTAEKAEAKSAIIDKLLSDEKLYDNEDVMNNAGSIISAIATNKDKDKLEKLLSDKELNTQQALIIFDKNNKISPEQIHKLNNVMGMENASKLTVDDTKIAVNFPNVYSKKNINEIPMQEKREFLKSLVTINENLFYISDEMKQMFPLVPTNQEEYCSLLPSIVRSLGIETNPLDNGEIQEFNKDINNLGNSLSELSDEQFNNLEIAQDYTKDEFIRDVLSKVKDLEPSERQKVYDYFGFELHKNRHANTQVNINGKQRGFSIVGYPVNLNNGKKLAQITDPNTREVVENLRADVIKFSENNKIICNNSAIEEELNNIVSVLPEIRTEIDKIQAGMNGTKGSHNFDIMKHSLKVMQKIVQNPEYNKLNESDKKLMLIASLLHDITKKEGYPDETHSDYGSFDTFFISKKFNLTQDEEIKLYNLVKHHEWLGYVNRAKSEEDLTKRLQNTAYDLRHDNMLEMALIFTHADLKAVRRDNSFHDITEGDSRKDFNGVIRSFGESADYYAEKIQGLIEKLKVSQPLLPVTEFPKASTIDKAITVVNEDGSTNIKGVYKNKNGLTVIKYNEVENWEEIGFPEGTISKGIEITTEIGEDVNTGNIKFFAHGLSNPMQLLNFDALSLVDSDALLSVSYAERPESKYRFFRPQGVILDCDTKYVHGGGETDSGSGTKKIVQEFKDNYIFGGENEADRVYISELIKETTGMSDEEYIEFVKANENKSFNELEPVEVREKIIKAFSGINSNVRKWKREYNEMYISNPKPPMAVFAYNMDANEEIGNPIEFLSRTSIGKYETESVFERTEFLQEYALERDIPFVVFCD